MSSSPSLTTIFWRSLRGLLYISLLGMIVFFGLTRTEVGRDRLRQEIESAFDREFAGSLDIGRLQGNLVNDLYASDVRISGPDGETVVSADSVTVRPRWTQLLTRELSVRSVEIHRPHVHAHRDSSGAWSVEEAFQRTTPPSGSPPLDVTVADIRIHDGQLVTSRDGAVPNVVRSNWLFDYTRTRVTDFDLQGTVDWTGAEKLVEVYDVTFDVPDAGVSFAAIQGQVVRDGDTWDVRQTRIATGGTDLRLQGSVNVTSTGEPNLDLTLAESRIDFDEMTGIVPRLPLRDLVTVSGRIIGPPSGFLLDAFTLRHGESRLSIQGTAMGLPDSLDYDVRLRDTRLRRSDMEDVLRDPLPGELAALNDVTLSVLSRGVIDLAGGATRRFDVSASVTAATDLGRARGDVAARRVPNTAVQYSAELDVDSLNLAPLTGRPALVGSLNGRVTGAGRGITLDSLDSDLTVNLRPSQIGEQRIDTARVDVTLTGRSGRAILAMRQAGGGELSLDADINAATARRTIRLSATTRDFDLAPLPGSLPATSLSGTVTAEGSGETVADATGRLVVDVDSSTITRADSLHRMPPHRVTVALASAETDAPRLRVEGDLLDLTATGDLDPRALTAVGRLWGRELADAVRAEIDKPMPGAVAALATGPTPTPLLHGADTPNADRLSADAPNVDAPNVDAPNAGALSPDTTSFARSPALTASVPALTPERAETPSSERAETPVADRASRRDSVRSVMQDLRQDGPLDVGVRFTIRDAETLRLWLPMLPPLADGLHSTVSAHADADTMSVQTTVDTDLYRAGRFQADSLRVVLRMNASLDRPLVASTRTRLDVLAHTARAGSLSVAAPRLSWEYAERSGRLRLTTDRKGRGGPFVLSGGLDVLPNRNVVTVDDLSAAVGDIAWSNPRSSTIDVYGNGIVVEPLLVESARPQQGGLQRIRVSGRLTPNEDDRLVARAENVLLYPVFDLLNVQRPLAGRLDGLVELSGRWTQPVLRADLTVGRFSFDRRQLGAVGISATYNTTSPDVAVALDIAPDSTSGPSLVPGGIRTVEPSTLSLNGRVRLPVAGADTLSGDPLDLNLSVQRADLFFFEYIFQDKITNVSGYTAGEAHIGGSFTDPLFDADMRVEEGDFTLPDFNLNYAIAGDVKVDEAGIHLAGVRVDDSDDGSADLNGSILFNDYRFFSFDLAGQLEEMTVIDVEDSDNLPFYGTIRASGPATLTGPLPDATLRSTGARTTPNSELFIPVMEEDVSEESGYIIFADSTGQLPDLSDLTRRDNLLADRPVGEPSFLEGLELDLNILAPEGSTVHLVFDPLVGDVVTAIGSGRIQLQRQEGEFFVYGTYEVEGGDYLFSAGEVFVRRFSIDSGTLTWDGDPVNAVMDLSAAYRTRASPAGLPNEDQYAGRIPVIVELDITGRVETPRVDLSLAVARDQRSGLVGDQTLDAILNQDDLATEYATSVLLTNTFLLTTSTLTAGGGATNDQSRIAEAGNQLAFNSVSQLVASQLNRYLSEALPNVDVNLGVSGEDPEDLDIIYGVALRLLNERLIIRGEGVYTGNEPDQAEVSGPQGEFVVEVRLSRSVSLEVFYRRAGDDVTRQTLTNTTGAGLSYQTEFSTWKRLFYQLFGWLVGEPDRPEEDTEENAEPGEAIAEDGGG